MVLKLTKSWQNTYADVVENPMTQALPKASRAGKGFFLVAMNSMRVIKISCCIATPRHSVNTYRLIWTNVSSRLATAAVEAAIILATPSGVNLNKVNIG